MKAKQYGASIFKTLDYPIHKNFAIRYPILICSYLGFLISYINTPDGALDPTFQMKYIYPSFLACLKPEILFKQS